jgi:single-strand DNA-binding protein
MSINKVILVGNVGKDPVVRYFDKGVAKATFPLATSETYTNQQGETITSTEWHNIVLWRALAEVAEKTIKKGAQVYIVGKIKTRSYVDKDGINKYITEILADTLLVLEKKQTQVTSAQSSSSGSDTHTAHGVNEPATPYHANEKNNPENDDFGADNRPDNARTDEDDLPF